MTLFTKSHDMLSWTNEAESAHTLEETFAGTEYDAFVSIEQSLRVSLAKHESVAEEALRRGIELRYGPVIAVAHRKEIEAEAKSRVAAIVRRLITPKKTRSLF